MKESKFSREFMKLLNNRGWFAQKLPSSRFSTQGHPDGFVEFDEATVWVEFKKDYNQLSKRQKAFRDKALLFAVIRLNDSVKHPVLSCVMFAKGQVVKSVSYEMERIRDRRAAYEYVYNELLTMYSKIAVPLDPQAKGLLK